MNNDQQPELTPMQLTCLRLDDDEEAWFGTLLAQMPKEDAKAFLAKVINNEATLRDWAALPDKHKDDA